MARLVTELGIRAEEGRPGTPGPGGVCFQADWHWLFLGGNITFRTANCNFLDKPEQNIAAAAV